MTMLSNQKRENKTSRGHRAWMKRQKTRKDALLEPGRKAPKFSLKSTPDQKVALDELRGNPLIIAFYPADWSTDCRRSEEHNSELQPRPQIVCRLLPENDN